MTPTIYFTYLIEEILLLNLNGGPTWVKYLPDLVVQTFKV